MKKISYLITLISFTFFIFQSCVKKDEITNETASNHTDYQIKAKVNNNNMLEFSSVKDFKETISYLNNKNDNSLLNKINKELSFVSMRDVLSEKEREKIGIEDDLLAAVLNKNGEIQIANYIYKIDIPNKQVYRMFYTDYIDSKSFKNKGKYETFSIYDELDDNGNIILNGRSSSCPDNNGFREYYTLPSGESFKYKLKYQSSLIYHSLLAKIKRQNGQTGGNIEYGMASIYHQPEDYSYYKKHNENTAYDIDFSYIGNYRKFVYRLEGKLDSYRLKVLFFARDLPYQDGDGYLSVDLEIHCHDSNGGGGGGGNSSTPFGPLPEIQ